MKVEHKQPVNRLESGVPGVTHREIADGLRRLGVRAGMGVMVHSSLKSFGRVEDGARTVIEALMEVITPDGTILMPSFNHGEPFEAGGPGCFDPRATRTTNGAIPDLFWRLPGVLRSLNPTHAFAAWGKNAERYVRLHHRTLTMGTESPLGLLWKDGGCGLFLGTTYGCNTFHHVTTTVLKSPCIGVRTFAYHVALPDGRRVIGRSWGWREEPCPLTDEALPLYAPEMEKLGLHRQTVVGQSHCTLFKLDDCHRLVLELLNDGKDGFRPCHQCPIRPRSVEEYRRIWPTAYSVAPDWDEEHDCLTPDSEAWNY